MDKLISNKCKRLVSQTTLAFLRRKKMENGVKDTKQEINGLLMIWCFPILYITQHAETLVGWWCVRSIVLWCEWVLSWVVAVRPGWSWKQWSVVLLWNIDVQEATRPVGSRPPPITGWPGQLAANRRSGWRHGQRPQTSWSEVSQPGPRIRRLRTNGGPGSVSEANIAGGRACEHCGPRDHEPWSATWLL